MTFENITKKNMKPLKKGLKKIIADLVRVPDSAVLTKINDPLGRQRLKGKIPVEDVIVTLLTMDEDDARFIKDTINDVPFKKNFNKHIKNSKPDSEEYLLKNATVILLSTTKALVTTAIGMSVTIQASYHQMILYH